MLHSCSGQQLNRKAVRHKLEFHMKKIFLSLLIIPFLLFLFSSCSNSMYSFSYSPINEAYADELDKINLGMSMKEVKKILPDIRKRGQTYVAGEIVEGLELQHNYWSGIGGYSVKDFLWFYFYQDKLVKWGKPNDWPEKADLIIEQRIR